MLTQMNGYRPISMTQFDIEAPAQSNQTSSHRPSLLKKAIIGIAAVGVFAGTVGGIVKAAMGAQNSALKSVQNGLQNYTSGNSPFNSTTTPFAGISESATNLGFSTPPLPEFTVTAEDITQGKEWLSTASSTPKTSTAKQKTQPATESTTPQAIESTATPAIEPTATSAAELTIAQATKSTSAPAIESTTTLAAEPTTAQPTKSTAAQATEPATEVTRKIFDINDAKCLRFEIAEKSGNSKVLLENHCSEEITASVNYKIANSTRAMIKTVPAGKYNETQLDGIIERNSFRFGKGQHSKKELTHLPDFLDKVKWIADPASNCKNSTNYKPLYAYDKKLFSPNGLQSQIIFYNKGAFMQYVKVSYKSNGQSHVKGKRSVAGLGEHFTLPPDASDVRLNMFIYRFLFFGSDRALSNDGYRTLKDNIYTTCDNKMNVMQIDSWGSSSWVHVHDQHPQGYYTPERVEIWNKQTTYNNGAGHVLLSSGHPVVDQRDYQRWNPKTDRPSPTF